MDPKTYKISKLIPSLGGLGMLFWVYVVLYNLDVIPWGLFYNVDALDLATIGFVVFVVIGPLPCIVAIGTLRFRAKLSPEGIEYRGFVQKIHIPWDKVTYIWVPGRGCSLRVYWDGGSNQLLYLVGGDRGLECDIVAYARSYAPRAGVGRKKLR